MRQHDAKPLVFRFGDHDLSLQMVKIDRSKLYGSKETLDDHGGVCELATLADDARTIIGKGGTGLVWLDADGSNCDKSQLQPVDLNGDQIKPVKSSFGNVIKLFDTATPAEYLDHTIRLAYELQPIDEDFPAWTISFPRLKLGPSSAFRIAIAAAWNQTLLSYLRMKMAS